MSLAVLYQPIYLMVITLCTLLVVMEYGKSSINVIASRRYSNDTFAFLIFIACTIFVGLRPLDGIFGDTMNYVWYYDNIDKAASLTRETRNVFFDNLLTLFSIWGLPVQFFFTFIAAIYFGAMLLACKRLFPNHVLITYLVCLGAFSTFSYGTNGIKAGVAASVFLLALAYKNKKIPCLLLLFASYGFHHSMVVVGVAYFCAILYKNTKMYFVIWSVCVLLAALHIQYFQILFAGFANDKGAEYLMATKDDEFAYITGFRPDFLIYSAVPILIGYRLLFKKCIHDANYELLLRIYLLSNAVWILCMYASFSNRIAYISWCMFPIIIIYPFVKIDWLGNKTLYIKRTALYHLGFTLFMYLIYYNL